MADSFSIDPGAAVQQGASAATQAPQTQITSVANGPAPVQALQNNPNAGFDGATAQALLKLGSDILAPKVKEAAQTQYMEGVKAASQGAAITDIIRERPWWSDLFGVNSAVQGARAYTVAATVAKFGADMETQMPMLAQQDASALDAKVKGLQQGLATGDPAADMAITAQIVDQMAPLYKRHAKEHVEFNQRKASDSQVDLWTKLGSAYQQRAAASAKDPTKVSPEDVKADADRLLGNMNPFGDQPDSSFDRNVAQFMGASASEGNFQVVKLFKDNGLFDKLPPQYRQTLESTFRSGARVALNKAMPQFSLEVAMATQDMAQNPATIPARLQAINDKAAAATGVSTEYGQLIPPETFDNVQGRVLTHQATAGAAAAKEAAGLALSAQMINQPGGVGPCKSIDLCKAAQNEQAALTQWNQSADPVKRAQLLNNNGTETFSSIKSNLLAALNTKEDTPGTQATRALYDSMNEETKGRYFNDDDQKLLDRYSQMVAGGEAPAAAWQIAKVVAPMAKFYLDPKEKNATAKSIRDWVEAQAEDQNGLAGMVGFNGLTDSAIASASMAVAAKVANGRAGNGIDRTVRRSMSDAVASGRVQMIGDHVALGNYDNQQPLTTMLGYNKGNMGPEAVGDTFNHVMAEKAKAVEADMADYTILRTDDHAGQARFMVEAVNKKGKVQSWTITSDELRGAYSSGLVKARDKKQAFETEARGTPQTPVVDSGFGPTIVPR